MRLMILLIVTISIPCRAHGLWSAITGNDWHQINSCDSQIYRNYAIWASEQEIVVLRQIMTITSQSKVCACLSNSVYETVTPENSSLADDGPDELIEYEVILSCLNR